MVAAGGDGVARLYGTWTGGEEAIVLPTGGVPLRDAAFNPSEERQFEVATVGIDGRVRIWRDIFQSELPARNLMYLGPELAATPDGRRYAIVGRGFWYGIPTEWEPTAEVIDAVEDRPIVTRTSLEGFSGAPAISPDGAFVSFTGPTGDVEIVGVDTGTSVRLEGSAGRDGAQAFSHDGAVFASASSANPVLGEPFAGSIAIWDATSGQLLRVLEGHGDRIPVNSSEPELAQRVEQLTFRPDSDELASVGRDGTVRIWDLTSGQGKVLGSFHYELISLAYSPEGSRLAVAERTGDVHILDSATGDELLVLDSVSGPPDLVFSPDGSLLAGAGPGPYAHLWNASDGRLVRRIRGSVYRPMGVAFLDEGDELLVLATEGILRRYLLVPRELVDLARDRVSRELTEDECQRYVGQSCSG